GRELFGDDAALQFERVMGSSIARIAEAAMLSFLVNVEDPLRSAGPRDVDIARVGAEALDGLSIIPSLFSQLFMRHLEAAMERMRARAPGAADVFDHAV